MWKARLELSSYFEARIGDFFEQSFAIQYEVNKKELFYDETRAFLRHAILRKEKVLNVEV